MKRVLVLALALLALALFVFLRPSAMRADIPAPAVDAQREAESAPAADLEAAPNAQHHERTSLAEPSNTTDAPRRADKSATAGIDEALLRVQVLYAPSGQPVRAAVVRLSKPNKEVRTDARGIAELRLPVGIELGPLRVDPSGDGDRFVPYEHNHDELLEPAGRRIEVRVERGADLRGIVRDAATGRALSEAHVQCSGLGFRTNATTGEDGSFELIALLSNAWNPPPTLFVVHASHLGASVQTQVADLAPGASPLVITLQPGIILSGRLLDPDQKPLVRAYLTLATSSPRQTTTEIQGRFVTLAASSQQTTTDDLGHFEFDSLPPSESATLSIPTQSLGASAVIQTTLELGPVSASRFDVDVQVQVGVELHVFAELPGGKRLDAFDVVDGTSNEPLMISLQSMDGEPTSTYHTRIVLRGRDVELEAFAKDPDESDPGAYLHGKTRVTTQGAVASPLDVHIVLGERGRQEIPRAPPGAEEIEIGFGQVLMGVVDVQVFDATSAGPAGTGHKLVLSTAYGRSTADLPEGGWVRLRGGSGAHLVKALLDDGPKESFVVAFPTTGYAKTEWRMRSKP